MQLKLYFVEQFIFTSQFKFEMKIYITFASLIILERSCDNELVLEANLNRDIDL